MAEKAAKKPVIVIRDNLKQRDVTAFDLELARIPGNYLLARKASSRMAAYLKAAIGADWIAEPACKARDVVEDGETRREYMFDGGDVDDMDPRTVFKAGHLVSELYDEFTSLDPS